MLNFKCSILNGGAFAFIQNLKFNIQNNNTNEYIN